VLAALVIFLGTYLVLAIGGVPGLRTDRTGAAIIGGTLMIACNVLSIEEAYRAINYDTIVLFFGTRIVVANLRFSGFFAAISEGVVEHAHHPFPPYLYIGHTRLRYLLVLNRSMRHCATPL
jgi:Na+/H+ antiporter NhaD/arsenite permease-like protein